MSNAHIEGLWALMPFRTGSRVYTSRVIRPKREEFEVLLSGKAVYIIQGKTIELVPGDAVWMHTGDKTMCSNAAGTPYESVVYSFIVNKTERPPVEQVYRWAGLISAKQFTDDALHCLKNNDYDTLSYCNYLYGACKIHLLPKSEIEQENKNKLDEILTFLKINLRENLSNERIAENFSMSTNQLSYLFQINVGMPPFSYLKRLRLNQAEEYLINTDKTVRWIAYMCGYKSESGFNRAFVAHYKKSPLQFRNQR